MLLDELLEILQEERKNRGNIEVAIGNDEPRPESIKGVFFLNGKEEEFECEDCCNDCEYIEAVKDIKASVQGL